jgi:hypothetical protein
MKKTRMFLLILLCAFLLNSCAMIPGVTKEPVEEPSYIDINDLDKHAVHALIAIEQAKLDALNGLRSFPYTRVASPSRINLKNKTDYFQFKTSKLAITEHSTDPQGTRTLSTLCLSVDEFGRRDLSENRIIYKVQRPTKEEAAAISKSLIKDAQLARKLKHEGLRNLMKTPVVDYQKSKGLSPDGILGKQTASSLVQDISIIEIQELTTLALYPEKPAFKAYIIRADAIDKNEFKKGFESINTVKEHALSLDELKGIAKSGEKFIACIYFFDRVNPTYALKWGFANRADSMPQTLSAFFYANPEIWPMVLETFTTESDIKSEKLYVNLLKKSEGFLGLLKVIGSHEIE